MTDEREFDAHEERGSSQDETQALVATLKERLRASKSRLKIVREVPGVNVPHWRLTASLVSANVDLELEAAGLSLHEAAAAMEIILDGVL